MQKGWPKALPPGTPGYGERKEYDPPVRAPEPGSELDRWATNETFPDMVPPASAANPQGGAVRSAVPTGEGSSNGAGPAVERISEINSLEEEMGEPELVDPAGHWSPPHEETLAMFISRLTNRPLGSKPPRAGVCAYLTNAKLLPSPAREPVRFPAYWQGPSDC